MTMPTITPTSRPPVAAADEFDIPPDVVVVDAESLSPLDTTIKDVLTAASLDVEVNSAVVDDGNVNTVAVVIVVVVGIRLHD